MAINLNTLGIKVYYGAEATAGTRPLAMTAYTQLVGAKSTPSLNPTPETIETTTLEETVYKTYVDGLKDLGGALSFKFNLTEALISAWEALMTAYAAAAAAGKATWFVIIIPGLTKSFYFTGTPSALGLPETAVNGVLETECFVTPTGAPITAVKPT
jgi:hypothetical protein